jgi:protein-S-isoprenylcysteine O-methyltransferase Ste14
MDIFQLTVLWIIIGLIIFPINLIYKAPYGRHTSKKWGISIDNKLGWIIMELPALLVCPAIYFYFKIDFDISIMFICLWIIHYFNRTIIFPFRIKTKGKKMPLAIVLSAFFFNIVNGLINGYFLSNINLHSVSIFLITGFLLFVLGLYINISSDNKLINLRKIKKGYFIPKGGLFKYISCPNFFGEILEWFGFALMTFNIGSLSFFIWTCCNLIPRALAHHKWYKNKFNEYPKERKAILPFLI